MVKVITSPAGSHWYITVNGSVVEGFVKRGHGRATLKQVERIADYYRSKVEG